MTNKTMETTCVDCGQKRTVQYRKAAPPERCSNCSRERYKKKDIAQRSRRAKVRLEANEA